MNLQKSLHQTSEQETQKPSAQLKKFQRLTEKLKKEKQRLHEWQTAKELIQQRVQLELVPLYAQLRQIKFEQVLLLADQMHKKFTPAQLEKLEDKMSSIALDLIRSQQLSAEQMAVLKDILLKCGMPDEVFDHPIFEYVADEDLNAHQQDADDTEQAQSSDQSSTEDEIEQIKQRICFEYDVDMDFFDFDYDPSCLEDFWDQLKVKVLAYEEQQILDQFDGHAREQLAREMQREKAKHAKKLQRRAEAKKVANQSIKTIYAKLAAMIHPDRERDEQKKDEKTVLFQQLNQAYANKDLFALLEFQAGLGQINQKNLAIQQLKAYNLILEEQLEQVDDQIEEIIECFDWGDDGEDFYFYSNPIRKVKELHHKFEQDLKHVQQHLEHNKQMSLYYQDIKMIKQMMRSRDIWEMH